MPRHPISDVHEWINESSTVPICDLAKLEPREAAWQEDRVGLDHGVCSYELTTCVMNRHESDKMDRNGACASHYRNVLRNYGFVLHTNGVLILQLYIGISRQ